MVRNGPELKSLRSAKPTKDLSRSGKAVLAYLGAIAPQDGLEHLLRALKVILEEIGRQDFICVIMGSGDSFSYITSLARDLGIEQFVRFTGFVGEEIFLRYLASADICLVPDFSSPSNDVSTFLKVMDYMASGKPMVCFDLKETRFTAREAAYYVKPNDIEQFAQAVVYLMDRPAIRLRMGKFGKKRIQEKLAWEHVSEIFLHAYDWLLLQKPSARCKQRASSLFLSHMPNQETDLKNNGLWNNLFYFLKPAIPRWIQLAARRHRAKALLKRYKDVWPINRKSATKPANWKGWPQGKQFALVLTHDVELALGHEKCLDLAAIENKMGFRSSFYFVPERYRVSASLRARLERDGFEVGVHGLVHDGKLFRSRKIFSARKDLINKYISEWQSVGFRSPSMLKDLDWIHEINIKYDASTFDTDPFEPDPLGAGTIFPVWINHKKHGVERGYVELPYTLPQDFTLFVIMRVQSIDLWKQKLDWIAQNGGMALVNTHPDYMSFISDKKDPYKYPIRYYEELLGYLSDRYRDHFWHVLPREIASFWKTEVVRSS